MVSCVLSAVLTCTTEAPKLHLRYTVGLGTFLSRKTVFPLDDRDRVASHPSSSTLTQGCSSAKLVLLDCPELESYPKLMSSKPIVCLSVLGLLDSSISFCVETTFCPCPAGSVALTMPEHVTLNP
jgi:hypothetical protein